jgi:hypothetical protein
MGAPRVPIVESIARAAGLVLHEFIILSKVHDIGGGKDPYKQDGGSSTSDKRLHFVES